MCNDSRITRHKKKQKSLSGNPDRLFCFNGNAPLDAAHEVGNLVVTDGAPHNLRHCNVR